MQRNACSVAELSDSISHITDASWIDTSSHKISMSSSPF